MTGYPKMAVRIERGRALCGRPGCDHALGLAQDGYVVLKHSPGRIWAHVYPNVELPTDRRFSAFVFRLVRRRKALEHTAGPINEHGVQVMPRYIVECPRCRSPQFVPDVDNWHQGRVLD